MRIRPMKPTDWQNVEAIYLEAIATGFATFETESPGWEHWNERHLESSRLVADEDGEVIGWAALLPVSSRTVYEGVAEVAIYVGKKARGKGVGKQLLQTLIIASEAEGFWTLESQIFPENRAALALHLKNGFSKVGLREKIGQHDGVWKDNILLERRRKGNF